MTSLFGKVKWWLERRRNEAELREKLEFHLSEEADDQQAEGLTVEQARHAALRDLGNVTLVREDAGAVWTWTVVEQLAQDVRYALRTMIRNPAFSALAALSLALGIGANTAIYSFMDSILLRWLPVADPASLAVVKWRSGPVNFGAPGGSGFVLHSIDGSTYRDSGGVTAAIFPYAAFERLQEVAGPVFSSLFAYCPAGTLNVMIHGQAELTKGHYVSGEFFHGLAVSPAAGRPLAADDDRAGADPVVVVSSGYSERRFGGAGNAIGQSILINNVAFTVVGVTPPEFFGVDPGAAPSLYLPLHSGRLLNAMGPEQYIDQNYYWLEMMGRLRPGVGLARAQAALAGPFEQWVASTATNPRELTNLPVLRLEDGAGGLDTLRRQYSKPLYVLLVMVGLILAIACANTANLLLARSAARTQEMAIRLSLGAGRWRLVRQLLTESVLLAGLSGVLGVLIALAGIPVLTQLIGTGQASAGDSFTIQADLNWHVLLVTLALSGLCGILFGLAPALQASRPALMSKLRDRSMSEPGARLLRVIPRVSLRQALVVAQIAISLLLLIAAGLFVRTLSNLQSLTLGFNRENVLLFDINAPQAGLAPARTADFYLDLRERLRQMPGVREATLAHDSLIRAGRSYPVLVGGQRTQNTRILWTGPQFFSTMQIPVVRGREINERDRLNTQLVAVVSELFAKTNFGDADPVGRQIEIGDVIAPENRNATRVLQIVGVAANARYGALRRENPPVVYIAMAQVDEKRLGRVVYALRTDTDPLRYAAGARQIVRDADTRVPVTNIKTQAADIDQNITQELAFAKLCSAFAILALTIACVGLYATMAYAVARRTSEIGLRMALGAGRSLVVWMVLREVCVLAIVGLAIAIPTALATSRFVESFLFGMSANDPKAMALSVAILVAAALAAGYGPARRASRIDPMVALRHE
jgi:predicted permease